MTMKKLWRNRPNDDLVGHDWNWEWFELLLLLLLLEIDDDDDDWRWKRRIDVEAAVQESLDDSEDSSSNGKVQFVVKGFSRWTCFSSSTAVDSFLFKKKSNSRQTIQAKANIRNVDERQG